MGSIGGLFGGDPSTTTKSESWIELPAWYEDTLKENVLRSQDVSQEGFQEYGEDRFSNFSQDELDAFAQLRNFVQSGQTQDLLSQSQGLMDFAAQRTTQGPTLNNLQQYMSPYQQGVIDPVKLDAIRQFDNTRSMIGTNAVNAGAFGGERHGLLESEALNNLNENLSDIQARGSQANYMNALNQYNLGTQSAGNMGSAIANLANVGQSLNIQGAEVLRGIGGMQRGLEQAGRDFDYSEFIREIQQPYTDTQFLSNIIGQVNPGIFPQHQKTVETTDDGSSPLGTIAGMALGAIAGPMGPAIMGGLGAGASAMGMSGLGSTLSGIATGLGSGFSLGQMASSAMGRTGGFDPTTGVNWASGRHRMKEGGLVPGYKEGGKVQKYANGDLVQVDPLPEDTYTPRGVPNPFADLLSALMGDDVLNKNKLLPELSQELPVREVAPLNAVPAGLATYASPEEMLATVQSQQEKQEGVRAREKSPTPQENRERVQGLVDDLPRARKDGVNMPLMMMGLAMMGTKGDFGQQLSAGGEAYLRAKELEKSREADRTKSLLEMMDVKSRIQKREAEIAKMPLDQAKTAAEIEYKKSLTEKSNRSGQIDRRTLMSDREDALKEYNELASSLGGEDLPPKSQFLLDFLTGKGYTMEEIQQFAPDLASGRASLETSGIKDPLGLGL